MLTDDKRSMAIIIGAAVGLAVVAATAAIYVSRHHEQDVRDINVIVDQARETVKQLDQAVEVLRKSVA